MKRYRLQFISIREKPKVLTIRLLLWQQIALVTCYNELLLRLFIVQFINLHSNDLICIKVMSSDTKTQMNPNAIKFIIADI